MVLPTDPSSLLLFAVALGALALKAWAFGDAVLRPAPTYPAAGKLSKPAWVAILAVSLLFALLGFGSGGNPLGFLGIIGSIAAIVYLVDVRPALRELSGGG